MNNFNGNNDLVACSYCRRIFDASNEGFVNPENSQRICSSCYRKNYETTGVVKKTGNLILTIVGGFFAFMGLTSLFTDMPGFGLSCILLGAAFFAWKYVPIYKRKKEAEKWKPTANNNKKGSVTHWHCSHCGANTSGAFCEYCNSPYGSSD